MHILVPRIQTLIQQRFYSSLPAYQIPCISTTCSFYSSIVVQPSIWYYFSTHTRDFLHVFWFELMVEKFSDYSNELMVEKKNHLRNFLKTRLGIHCARFNFSRACAHPKIRQKCCTLLTMLGGTLARLSYSILPVL